MPEKRQLTTEGLMALLQTEDIEALQPGEIFDLFSDDEAIKKFAPDGVCQVDPRNGERVVFNSARARRPHDNRPGDSILAVASDHKNCAICLGNTTPVVDVANLSHGFTFINKNLFPILFPSPEISGALKDQGEDVMDTKGLQAEGMHFLQWTSSYHDLDWQNMPLKDRVVVLERLAALEESLLRSFKQGYVSIIKNYGRLVGGSLAHGHQQICYSNLMPRRIHQNRVFELRTGETFSDYLLEHNPAEYMVRDYGSAVLLVSYFMRRPFDLYLMMKDSSKKYLYDLEKGELEAVASGWQDAIRAIMVVMPQIGRETAFNVITHTGPGAGLYFEFLPYTQEMGGFEHLGLFLCQGNPRDVAAQVREILSQDLDTVFSEHNH